MIPIVLYPNLPESKTDCHKFRTRMTLIERMHAEKREQL